MNRSFHHLKIYYTTLHSFNEFVDCRGVLSILNGGCGLPKVKLTVNMSSAFHLLCTEAQQPKAGFSISYLYVEVRSIKVQHIAYLTSRYAMHTGYGMPEISIRLLIHKEQKRVVYAEAGSDFIDVIFSFLTLPLGSIVQLLGKQSGLGSLDNLYKSVEQLDYKHLQTEACKEMLLKPRSAAAKICEDLKIKNIHETNPRISYICNEDTCSSKSTCYCTYVIKTRCSLCGKLMGKSLNWPKGTVKNRGVFVNEGVDFIITDDLRVMSISLMSGFSVLEELLLGSTLWKTALLKN